MSNYAPLTEANFASVVFCGFAPELLLTQPTCLGSLLALCHAVLTLRVGTTPVLLYRKL